MTDRDPDKPPSAARDEAIRQAEALARQGPAAGHAGRGDSPHWIEPPVVKFPPGTPVVHLKSAHYDTFLYAKMVGRVEGNPRNGDLVAVVDKQGRFFGWAFYNARSQIVLRMFSREVDRPDEALLAGRIAQAVALRRDILHLDRTSDAYRLVHAEGDGLTGLVADRFGQYVVLELFSLAMVQRLEQIQDAFVDAGLTVREFVVRVDKSVAQQEGIDSTKLRQPRDSQTVIEENGAKFSVMLGGGHKTGFFCDQRENRLALADLTAGRRVLDLCCYTGGFAVYAAGRGAAAEVTAVDLDEQALATAAENGRLNQARIKFLHADGFDFLRQAGQEGRTWDVVVVDPSKFVPRRSSMELGLRKYADLNRLAAGVVARGGLLLTCSCSGLVDQPTFVQTVGRAARAAGRGLQIFRLTGAGPDHPFQADTPEGQYLKAVWCRVE
jgi:23S rRNA (cytosine1962-C5)-methyltransferase